MSPLNIVQQWDSALRLGDWAAARALLDDSASYHTPEADDEMNIDCHTGDEIVELMAAWKGQMPDIQVVEWSEHGNQVLARLRQPAWGDDNDWFQVIAVEDGLIAAFTDFRHESSAVAHVLTAGG